MTERDTEPFRVAEVDVGDRGPTLVVESIDRKDFVKYAGASGDFSRLHYDEPYAKSIGNESVFAQGMLTAGLASAMVSDWFGIERIARFRVRFTARVWPGDTVSVTGEVTDVSTADDHTDVEASIRATTQEGTEALTGDVSARFPVG